MTPRKSYGTAQASRDRKTVPPFASVAAAWRGGRLWDPMAVGNPRPVGVETGGPPGRSVCEIVAERSAQIQKITRFPMGFFCASERGHDS